MKSVYSAARTGPVNEAVCALSLKGYPFQTATAHSRHLDRTLKQASAIATLNLPVDKSSVQCRATINGQLSDALTTARGLDLAPEASGVPRILFQAGVYARNFFFGGGWFKKFS
jgi:uncharacterized protein YfaP (DUF2135 family)